MFYSQIKHYQEKFRSLKSNINVGTVNGFIKAAGMTDEEVEAGLADNSDKFRMLCYNIAKSMMPGKVSCTAYASVVAYFAEKYHYEYKVMSGFCLPKSLPNFDKEIESFNKKRAEGVEHPVFATHVYVVINGKDYEFYNGETSNIEHIDCVEIN